MIGEKSGMDKIDLPKVSILQHEDGSLVLTHKQTGMAIPLPRTRLENWAIRKLRESLDAKPLDQIAETR